MDPSHLYKLLLKKLQFLFADNNRATADNSGNEYAGIMQDELTNTAMVVMVGAVNRGLDLFETQDLLLDAGCTQQARL